MFHIHRYRFHLLGLILIFTAVIVVGCGPGFEAKHDFGGDTSIPEQLAVKNTSGDPKKVNTETTSHALAVIRALDDNAIVGNTNSLEDSRLTPDQQNAAKQLSGQCKAVTSKYGPEKQKESAGSSTVMGSNTRTKPGCPFVWSRSEKLTFLVLQNDSKGKLSRSIQTTNDRKEFKDKAHQEIFGLRSGKMDSTVDTVGRDLKGTLRLYSKGSINGRFDLVSYLGVVTLNVRSATLKTDKREESVVYVTIKTKDQTNRYSFQFNRKGQEIGEITKAYLNGKELSLDLVNTDHVRSFLYKTSVSL